MIKTARFSNASRGAAAPLATRWKSQMIGFPNNPYWVSVKAGADNYCSAERLESGGKPHAAKKLPSDSER